ncbi:hypothetical protein E2C01_037239 [Portunus trituberculatus]|uniref:Secreted protein n=1 Tax=Portunus trituberculatus TaxID=210409 RepID=A0A5B7FEF8_PORTR|nr:hypothetical protein [Portunus trituberculatus]
MFLRNEAIGLIRLCCVAAAWISQRALVSGPTVVRHAAAWRKKYCQGGPPGASSKASTSIEVSHSPAAVEGAPGGGEHVNPMLPLTR